MEVIAKTNGGVIISATENEIKEILTSVNGERPKEINIGQKIPALDYATTVKKLRGLKGNAYLSDIATKLRYFKQEYDELCEKVNSMSETVE